MGQLEQEDYEIKVTMTIESSISRYFTPSYTVLKNFDKYLNRHRELHFVKMRRFLHTTFNSLSEIDPHFKSTQIVRLYDNMKKVAKVYDDFALKRRMGIRAYHVVFLQQQERYAMLENLLKHNLSEIDILREQTLGFKKNVKKRKDELQSAPEKSTLYHEKSSELKDLKRRENSTIMRMNEVAEQNEIITHVLRDFRDTYEDQFLLMYKKYTQGIQPKLFSILNAMAFEFDVEIWLQASQSTLIKNYFKSAYTNDVINSKTYLTYYLKGLDKSKLTEENQDLQELLDYLTESTPINCVIYMPQEEDLKTFQTTLEADDNGIEIHGYTDAKIALTQAFKMRIDILLIDLETDSMILENFLSLYQKNAKKLQKKAKVMFVCSEATDYVIAKAELLGADSLIEKGENPYEIIDALYDLLKVEGQNLDTET